jgi:hypothetical protein
MCLFEELLLLGLLLFRFGQLRLELGHRRIHSATRNNGAAERNWEHSRSRERAIGLAGAASANKDSPNIAAGTNRHTHLTHSRQRTNDDTHAGRKAGRKYEDRAKSTNAP